MLVTIVFTYQGFIKMSFTARYLFNVEKVLVWKEYFRLVSSGFLHADWVHLCFNMLTLYFSSQVMGFFMSWWYFLILYFVAMIGGNALALFLNRHNYSYSALGASGAVNGILFAAAVAAPTLPINLFFFLPMPFWAFALLYMVYTLWGIKAKRDNIGHEAHLGGAVVGIIMMLIYSPDLLVTNWWMVLLLMVPIAFFFYIVLVRPEVLLVPKLLFKGSNKSSKKVSARTINRPRPKRQPSHVSDAIIRPMRNRNTGPNFASPEEEINFLLDKGVENLTAKEKKRLDELSNNIE